MAKVGIFWDPKGFQLDSLGTNKYLRATDGDTPYVSMSIRMLSIDTPEVHYPGITKPSKQDTNLSQLAEWMRQGKAPINDDLAEFLIQKLQSGTAGTLQEEQGEKASTAFQELIDKKLHEGGKNRTVYLHSAEKPFDQ